jgi:hypothetical protein
MTDLTPGIPAKPTPVPCDPVGPLADAVRAIILTSRRAAVRSVDFERVRMYWRIGQRIVVEVGLAVWFGPTWGSFGGVFWPHP